MSGASCIHRRCIHVRGIRTRSRFLPMCGEVCVDISVRMAQFPVVGYESFLEMSDCGIDWRTHATEKFQKQS